MTISDGLLILATLVSPFLAVCAQKQIERWRNARDTKLWIFKTLMATRAASLSPNHVHALNMIDLEFSDSKVREAQVKTIWREYLDHLGSLPANEDDKLKALPAWIQKNQDYLADLLVAMGKCLGYEFDRVYIKKGIYAPEGHAKDEAELRAIRNCALQLLTGERVLYTAAVPANTKAAQIMERLQQGFLGVLEGKNPIVTRQLTPSQQNKESESVPMRTE